MGARPPREGAGRGEGAEGGGGKGAGEKSFSKKVLAVSRNAVAPLGKYISGSSRRLRARTPARPPHRALASPLPPQPQGPSPPPPWTPSRRRCRCSSSTRRTPWIEPSRRKPIRRRRRTEASRSAPPRPCARPGAPEPWAPGTPSRPLTPRTGASRPPLLGHQGRATEKGEGKSKTRAYSNFLVSSGDLYFPPLLPRAREVNSSPRGT